MLVLANRTFLAVTSIQIIMAAIKKCAIRELPLPAWHTHRIPITNSTPKWTIVVALFLPRLILVLPIGTQKTGLLVALIGNFARQTGQTFFIVTRHIALQYIRSSQTIVFARYLSIFILIRGFRPRAAHSFVVGQTSPRRTSFTDILFVL